MKAPILHLVVILASLGAHARAAAVDPIQVAVCDFRGWRARANREFADLVIENLAKDPRIVALDRGELDKVFAEKALDLSRDIDPGTAAVIGRLAGAAVIVTGTVSNGTAEGSFTLRARIIGATTGRAFSEEANWPGSSVRMHDRPIAAAELSRKIIAAIFAHQSELIDTARPTREMRLAELVALASGNNRPTVSLHFTTGSRAGVVSDATTVETELGLIFQRAGFAVIDESSAEKAAVEIVGEALASLGAKLGPLYPCHAVISLKVRARESGRILVIDRQSADGTDIGEQTAISAAFEAATDALAARLLPLLSH